MSKLIHVSQVHVVQIVNVEWFMSMPFVPVYQVILVAHQIVDQNALSALNVLKIEHVSIKNVLIHVYQSVAKILAVK